MSENSQDLRLHKVTRYGDLLIVTFNRRPSDNEMKAVYNCLYEAVEDGAIK